MSPIYFLILPALVSAKISIFVDVTTNEPLIDVSGYSSILLPEKERPLFKLDDKELKDSVANYSKQAPTDVFVRNAWGDLYTAFKWREVRRIVKPTLKTKTKTEMSRICGDVPREPVKNLTVTVNWKNGTVETSEIVDYRVIHGSSDLKFSPSWGKSVKKNKSYPIAVKPQMLKCVVNVFLEYEASLFGDVVANYKGMRQGHHFWAYDVNVLQAATEGPVKISYNQNISIVYFE